MVEERPTVFDVNVTTTTSDPSRNEGSSAIVWFGSPALRKRRAARAVRTLLTVIAFAFIALYELRATPLLDAAVVTEKQTFSLGDLGAGSITPDWGTCHVNQLPPSTPTSVLVSPSVFTVQAPAKLKPGELQWQMTLNGVTHSIAQHFSFLGNDEDKLKIRTSSEVAFRLGAQGQMFVTVLGTDVDRAPDSSLGAGNIHASFRWVPTAQPIPKPAALIPTGSALLRLVLPVAAGSFGPAKVEKFRINAQTRTSRAEKPTSARCVGAGLRVDGAAD